MTRARTVYHLGQYICNDSPVHRLDPRVKVLSLVALSMMILKAGLCSAILISVFIGFTGMTAQLTARRFMDSIKPLAPFIAALFAIHLLLTDGAPILNVMPGVAVTSEGLCKGILTAWRFAALVTGACILTVTTSPSELISGIERLLRPFGKIGVPSHDIAVMISLALRFAPTILSEAERMKKAQLSRGADFSQGSGARRARAVAALAAPLVLGSCRRAEELARAMEARGYERGPRTYLRELRLTPLDYRASVLMAAFIAGNHFLNAL